LRTVTEGMLQILMEADVEGQIGAGRHERSAERLTYRNGYRDRKLDTRLGSPQLRIPKLRQGSYFPPFLEPRRTSEKALAAVIQEAWIRGVSDPAGRGGRAAMGLSGISKSQVSKLCKDIDERVNAFLEWRFGYSRDHRLDCVEIVVALVVTPEGLPLAYEVTKLDAARKQAGKAWHVVDVNVARDSATIISASSTTSSARSAATKGYTCFAPTWLRTISQS
jgi:hypothetical protein